MGTDLPAAGVPMVPADPAQRYALLVGIGRYPKPEHGLPSPPFDLAALRDVLVRRYGFIDDHILVLPDDQATRDAIINAFATHLAKAGPAGLALFYFVGHGLPLDRNYSVQDKENSGHDQALFVWGSSGRGTVILDDELDVLLRRLPAGRRLAIVDACYSGSADKFMVAEMGGTGTAPVLHVMSARFLSSGDPADIPSAFLSDGRPADPLPDDRLFLGAAEETRRAYSVEHWPTANESRSIFNRFLVNELDRARAEDSFTTLMERVRADAREVDFCSVRSRCQTPQIGGTLASHTVAEILGPPR